MAPNSVLLALSCACEKIWEAIGTGIGEYGTMRLSRGWFLHGLGTRNVFLWALMMAVGLVAASQYIVDCSRTNQSISLLIHVIHSLAHWMGWVHEPYLSLQELEVDIVEIPKVPVSCDVKCLPASTVDAGFDIFYAFPSDPITIWSAIYECITLLIEEQFLTLPLALALPIRFIWINIAAFVFLRIFAILG